MASNPDLAIVAEQERLLVFEHFDEETAWSLGSHLRAWALAGGHPVVIDIHAFGRQVFFSAMRGASPDNLEWVRRKRNVALRFHRSSYAIGLQLAEKGNTLEHPYGLAAADFAAHGGAFPLRIAGSGVVGCVTVSGLPQREDHGAVVRSLAAVLGVDAGRLALD